MCDGLVTVDLIINNLLISCGLNADVVICIEPVMRDLLQMVTGQLAANIWGLHQLFDVIEISDLTGLINTVGILAKSMIVVKLEASRC